jgi:hypothetical protein
MGAAGGSKKITVKTSGTLDILAKVVANKGLP